MFNIGVQVGNRYVLVVLSGEAGATEIQSMNVFVADLLARTGRRRVLLDRLSFSMDLPGQAAQAARQAIVAHMAATLPELERVAVLVQDESQRGLVRGAAAEREFQAAEFTDILDAERWLQADD